MLTARPIATSRTVLTPLTVADADQLAVVLDDPALHEFIGGEPSPLDELRARYQRLVVGHSADGTQVWLNWVIRLQPDRTAVGYVQATVVADGAEAEVAWVVGTSTQGRGYASEAAAALVQWLREAGVRTVVAHVHPDHVASARVASAAGLTRTEVVLDGEDRWQLVLPRA